MSKSSASVKLFSVDKLLSHFRTPLYRNAYALVLSTASTSGLGLLYWILAARYYTAEDYGLNAAAISVMIFLSAISQLNLHSAMVRFIPRAGGATPRLVGSAYLVTVVLSILVALVFTMGIDLWASSLHFLSESPWFILWLTLGVVGWSLFSLQDNVLAGLRDTVWVPLENTLYAVAKIGFLAMFAVWFPQYGIFASWTIPAVVILFPINVLIFKRLIPRHMRAADVQHVPISVSQIAKFVAGNYVGSLFLIASVRLLPVLVLYQAGARANAYFFLPWTIVSSLKLVTMNMVTSFTVEGARDPAKLTSSTRPFLIYIAPLLVPAVIVVVVAAPYILGLSRGDYAAEGTTALRLLALSVVPNIVTSLYIGIARVQQRIVELATVQASLCVLILGLSFLLLESHGITGVGIAVLASESIVAVVLLLTQVPSSSKMIVPRRNVESSKNS